jgi:hypothetical protein
MKGSLQICKSDVCVKADGDFAAALLLLLAVTLFFAIKTA